MPETFVLTLPAEKLQQAVRTAVPAEFKRLWRTKSWPVSLVLDRKRRSFRLSEARHELAAYDMPCTGRWPKLVQVDGRGFRHAVESYAANDLLELTAHPDRIAIRNGRSVLSLPRIDRLGEAPIKTKPIPKNKRHKGKPEVVDQPWVGRVELHDTWDFSARMPVPHHRFTDSILPPGEDGRGEQPGRPLMVASTGAARSARGLLDAAREALRFFEAMSTVARLTSRHGAGQ